MYLVGVAGSVGVELSAALKDLTVNAGQMPSRYKTISYPIARILFAVCAAGPLATLLATNPDWTAFYVGITAPLIFDRAAAGIKSDIAPPDLVKK